MLKHGPAPGGGGQWSQLLGGALSHRYGALTFGNVQKSIPASFGARAPATVRKIAVRRTAQVGPRCAPRQLGDGWAAAAVARVGRRRGQAALPAWQGPLAHCSAAVLSTEEPGGALAPWGALQLPPQRVWPSMVGSGLLSPQP